MIFRDIDFFISEALIGMKRSSLMILIAIAIISVSLVVFGLFLLLTVNVNNLANFVTEKLEIRIFLKTNLTRHEINEFKLKILKLEGISSVTFVPRDEAWESFKSSYKNIELGDVITSNPLPHSLQVKLENNKHISATAKYLSTFKYHVDEVKFGGILAERIQLFAKFTKWGGMALSLLLSFATLLIIVNTIRLTIMARQEEIEIMTLVGATKSFIRWPFIIEGLLMGLIGSLIAVIVLKFGYLFFGINFQESIPFFPLMFNTGTLNLIYFIVGITGALLGILGANISVTRSLKTYL